MTGGRTPDDGVLGGHRSARARAYRVVLYEERTDPIGGNQRYIQLLARFASGAGIDLHVITARQGALNDLLAAHCSVEALSRAGAAPGALRRPALLARRLRDLEPDVVLCNNARSLLTVMVPARLARLPLLWYVKVSKREKPLLDLGAVASVDRILAISPAVLDKKRSWTRRLYERKLRVLPIGIDLEPFLEIPIADPARDRPLEVLVVARIHPAKGLHILVEAVRLLGDRASGLRVRICGGIPAGREEYAAKLEASIAALPVDVVEVLGWRADIRPLLARSDVAVLPSFAEGVPRSLTEAMAAGRPVIATAVGGVPDLVVDGHIGRLVPPRDPDALAAALTWCLDHRAELAGWGRAARERVRVRHDIRDHVKQLAAHIAEVLEDNDR